jgi:2-polyprenyl-3-methyl-5-hydroxy-6-metoxy-1,4-benzoquinol methylase
VDCCRGTCQATAAHFDKEVAEDDYRTYRTKGLDKRARRLVEALVKSGIEGLSILDVGSGIGMIAVELLQHGAASATLADASPSYLEVAHKLGTEQSVAARMQFLPGDFVDTARNIPDVDVVVMDRVVCCYPAWRPLLTAASNRCRQRLAVTYPRNRPDVKFVIGLENFRRRLAKDDFRAFVHPPREMAAALEATGLKRIRESRTLTWKIDLYSRSS